MKKKKSDYSTCRQTYATFRVFHDALPPDDITKALGLTPDSTQLAGETWKDRKGVVHTVRINGWFFSTEGHVDSQDSEKHLVWLVKKLSQRSKGMAGLLRRGYRADISCMWDSLEGHGGPTLSPGLMKSLSSTGITLWFDVYFKGFQG